MKCTDLKFREMDTPMQPIPNDLQNAAFTLETSTIPPIKGATL